MTLRNRAVRKIERDIRDRNAIIEECALKAEEAREHAKKNYGVDESVGADIAARWIRGMTCGLERPIYKPRGEPLPEYCEDCKGPCLRKPPHGEGWA
jgi:hypothetical protein